MKRRLSLAALIFFLLPSVRFAAGQQLTVQSEDGKPVVLGRNDLEGLPRVQVSTGTASEPSTYEGVTVQSILEKAGIGFREPLKGKQLTSCLVVEAADGYRVVIALPELDPAFTDKRIVLAFLHNRKPLGEKEGPYRVVIPDEKRMARWVRQVTALKIVAVP